MSLYRRVSIRIWGDEKFKALSHPRPNAQTLFLYLFTGPHTGIVPGIFTAGARQLAESLEWTPHSFTKCFQELEAARMVVADWRCRVVYLPKAKYHNPPTNPNIILGWAAGFKDLPECALTSTAWMDFRNYGMTEALSEPLRQAFTKAFTKDFRNSSGSGIGREEHRKSSGSGSRDDGPEVAHATGSERPRQLTPEEQISAAAAKNGQTPDELRAAADALASTTARGMSLAARRRKA